MCADGVDRMRDDAETAVSGLVPDSRWRGNALLLLGVAHALAGDEGEAELVFADAGEIALRAGANGTASVVLAERSLLALANDDVESAEALLRVARAIVRDARLDGIRDDGAGACGVRALCDPSRATRAAPATTWRALEASCRS